MNFTARMIRRIGIFIVASAVLWLIITQVFDRLDNRVPLIVAIVATYFIAAYVLLPQLIHVGVMVLGRGRIPRITHAADGLAGDPVNIIFMGTAADLNMAFLSAGWYEADRLSLRSSWTMIVSFLFNRPYPTAPFSTFYLFGRKQDFGFQQAIGKSPRKRNHIRFWAANLDPETEISDVKYWMKKHTVDMAIAHAWVGAGSRDTGFGLTEMTYQISHHVDMQVDNERSYILSSLQQSGWIGDASYIDAGSLVLGKYVTDGRILRALLTRPAAQ
ncbi:MAG: LssY C-terminal domain-containing protein [Longimicrobiales bacterium]